MESFTEKTYVAFTTKYTDISITRAVFTNAVLYLCVIATAIPDEEILSELPMDELDSWVISFIRDYPVYASQRTEHQPPMSPHAYWKSKNKDRHPKASSAILDFSNVVEIELENQTMYTQILDQCMAAADAILESRYNPKVSQNAVLAQPEVEISVSVRRAAIDKLFGGKPPDLSLVVHDEKNHNGNITAGILAYRRWKASNIATHNTIIAKYVDAGLRKFAEADDTAGFWVLYYGFVSGLCDGW